MDSMDSMDGVDEAKAAAAAAEIAANLNLSRAVLSGLFQSERPFPDTERYREWREALDAGYPVVAAAEWSPPELKARKR